MIDRFSNDLTQINKSIESLKKQIDKVEELHDDRQTALLLDKTIQMIVTAEKLCNQVRLLPTSTGNPNAFNMALETIAATNDTKIEYTMEGWFFMQLPGLLPRKEKGNAKYIRSLAFSVMTTYFETHPKQKFFEPTVLIYQHVYSKDRKERAYRDHDNIEVNVINDLLALFCLADDGPNQCKHYYTSKEGDRDMTNIYIVPTSSFADWLAKE